MGWGELAGLLEDALEACAPSPEDDLPARSLISAFLILHAWWAVFCYICGYPYAFL